MTMGLAARFARRDLRGAALSFRFLSLCLTLGVAAIAAVGVFAAAVEEGLLRDGRALLGGDLEFRVIQRAANPDEREALDRLGTVSHVMTMRAMAEAKGTPKRVLIELKSVDHAYPLAGTVGLDPAMDLGQALAPQDGVFGAVAASGFGSRLGIDVGDRFTVGKATFELRAILQSEPDRGADALSFGPRVMVSEAGIESTGLVRPGSMIRHGYRLALTDRTPDQAAQTFAEEFPKSGFRPRSLAEATPQAKTQVERVRVFLTLVGFASLLVGGIGVAQSVQSHLTQKRPTIAILKSLGASSALIGRTYAVEVATMAAIGIVAGLALGAVCAIVAAEVAGDLLPLAFTARAVVEPLASAALAGILATFAFTVPPLARARAVSPAILLRGETDGDGRRTPWTAWPWAAAALVMLIAIFALEAPDRRIVLYAAVGTLAAAAILVGLGVAVRRIGGALHEHLAASGTGDTRLRLALANLARPGSATVPVTIALGLAMTLFVSLVEVESNMRREIEERIPDRAPAYFFIDIPPEDGRTFDSAVWSVRGAEAIERRPMVRGRIVAVNDTPIERVNIAPGARWVADGDRGLTVAPMPPTGTHIVAGEWWPSDYSGPPLISFDARAAQGFGVGVGDTLTLNILGREITGRIANLRAIDWTSFGVNFAMMLSPGALDGAPMSDIAAVYTTPDAEDAVADAVADKLPAVTAIRVREVLDSAISLLTRIAGATETVAAAAVAAGLLVLIGALAAARRAQLYETAVLRAVGASRATIIGIAAIEHAIIGLVAVIAAAILGTVAAWAAVRYAIGMEWSFAPLPALIAILATMAATGAFGAAAAWRLLAVPAARLLAADSA
ncbi:MAG TPA: FtsX-like permease family protein [Alphaproteobacteria bacterium]|nr:FtsX-like permease family protein [Alphaproteobacteria bacterium]